MAGTTGLLNMRVHESLVKIESWKENLRSNRNLKNAWAPSFPQVLGPRGSEHRVASKSLVNSHFHTISIFRWRCSPPLKKDKAMSEAHCPAGLSDLERQVGGVRCHMKVS